MKEYAPGWLFDETPAPLTLPETSFPYGKKFPNAEPLAAAADPSTSHEAAAKLTKSGARDSQKVAVLTALERARGAMTSFELAESSGLDRYVVARRLPDLGRDGFVEKSDPRECRITGNRAVTWKVARRCGGKQCD